LSLWIITYSPLSLCCCLFPFCMAPDDLLERSSGSFDYCLSTSWYASSQCASKWWNGIPSAAVYTTVTPSIHVPHDHNAAIPCRRKQSWLATPVINIHHLEATPATLAVNHSITQTLATGADLGARQGTGNNGSISTHRQSIPLSCSTLAGWKRHDAALVEHTVSPIQRSLAPPWMV
jgi:hypothetical protein